MDQHKKVIIKIHEDGFLELVKADQGVAVLLLLPDNSTAEVFEGDKKIWESGKDRT